jgi:xylulokinase
LDGESQVHRATMVSGAYVGVDVGTSGCKAVLIGRDGIVIHSAKQDYALTSGIDGSVTQDPADWDAAILAVLHECSDVANEHRAVICGIAATAPAHAVVLVDDQGEPLHRVILPYDQRSAQTAASMRASLGGQVFDRTFVELGPSWTLPQLVWLRHEVPELWPRIRYVLATKDYVTFRLTGVAVTDPSDAAGTAMYDQVARCWARDLLAEAGLSPDQVPPVLRATDVAGQLTREWSTLTGIPAGTPVAVGATDTAAELLSVGALDAGSGLVKIASTGTVVAVLDSPRPHPGLLTYPHVVSGRWYALTATNAAASAFAWLQQAMFGGHKGPHIVSYAEMDGWAAGVPPGGAGLLFLPFLAGERSPYWDPDLRAAFLGVSSAHEREHFTRAVLEGVAMSLRDCRDWLHERDIEVNSPSFTGGGVHSRLWRDIVASVLGVPGSLTTPHGPALGAAHIAAAAVLKEDIREQLARSHPKVEPVEPRGDWVQTYHELYAIYRDAAREVAPLSHRLARVARESLGPSEAAKRKPEIDVLDSHQPGPAVPSTSGHQDVPDRFVAQDQGLVPGDHLGPGHRT